MESWVGTKSFVEATMLLLFFECNRDLQRAGNVTLYKHVTHYGPRQGFLYYNIKKSIYSLHTNQNIKEQEQNKAQKTCFFVCLFNRQKKTRKNKSKQTKNKNNWKNKKNLKNPTKNKTKPDLHYHFNR